MIRENQRARTRRDLVAAALQLLTAGRRPTVSEVADAAGVSRRTAYRYFPTGEQLITEALLEGTRAGVEREIDAGAPDDGIASRVDRLVDALHGLTVRNEPLLRQMIRLTMDRDEADRGVPSRPSRRLEYVDQALATVRDQLPRDEYERLVHSMAMVIGIEARLVLRDICGLDDAQMLETERWAAQALLAAAIETRPEHQATGSRKAQGSRQKTRGRRDTAETGRD